MDILDDMGVSQLSANVFFKSELLSKFLLISTDKNQSLYWDERKHPHTAQG